MRLNVKFIIHAIATLLIVASINVILYKPQYAIDDLREIKDVCVDTENYGGGKHGRRIYYITVADGKSYRVTQGFIRDHVGEVRDFDDLVGRSLRFYVPADRSDRFINHTVTAWGTDEGSIANTLKISNEGNKSRNTAILVISCVIGGIYLAYRTYLFVIAKKEEIARIKKAERRRRRKEMRKAKFSDGNT